ncbi:hypothetical protein XFEB_01966 [Xylella fastidiosa EB92.1]|nr:hypothetical protein XFEB_01966 [Xylella fastidiosa EB92.1]
MEEGTSQIGHCVEVCSLFKESGCTDASLIQIQVSIIRMWPRKPSHVRRCGSGGSLVRCCKGGRSTLSNTCKCV